MRADVIGRVNEFLAGHRRDSLSFSLSLPLAPRSYLAVVAKLNTRSHTSEMN